MWYVRRVHIYFLFYYISLTAPIESLVKLQPWFLNFRWKPCLRQNINLGSCTCSEGTALGQNTHDDDDDDGFYFKRWFISAKCDPIFHHIIHTYNILSFVISFFFRSFCLSFFVWYLSSPSVRLRHPSELTIQERPTGQNTR